MNMVTGTTRGGTSWTPAFVESLNAQRCIGCGRCFKVCPRDVFTLEERDGEEDEEEFSDDTRMVMVITGPEDCIGCQACSKVCPKQCHQHAPLEQAA